jgi:hypothetical protein
MARIRTIKPEFWTHEGLNALPEATHLLAAALLNYADDEGYFNANPALIKAACSPLREPSVSIQDSLRRLAKTGYLQFAQGPDGRRYGRIVNFDEHQRVNRPTPSKISALQIVWESSLSPHTQLSEDSPLEGKGKEGKGTGKGKEDMSTSSTSVGDPAPDPVQVVFDHWRQVHNHPKAKLDSNRRKLIREGLQHYTADELCESLSGYLHSPHHQGQTNGTVYTDIGLLLRDAKHIDAGLAFHRNPPSNLSTLTRKNLAAVEDWTPPELRHAAS